MQHTRVIRTAIFTVAAVALFAGIWYACAWAGNHIPPWGALVLFIAIVVGMAAWVTRG